MKYKLIQTGLSQYQMKLLGKEQGKHNLLKQNYFISVQYEETVVILL